MRIPVLLLPPCLAGLLSLHAAGQCVTSFPSLQNFTSGTVGTPGTLPTNWANLTGDDLDWWVDNNGTPTANTGPIGDQTSNNTGGKYMYVSAAAAGNTPGKSAVLQSPCYNISGLASPYLTFWYHMRGAQMGSLHVDINNNGTITTGLWSVSGDQGQYWKQGWLDLSPWAGQNNLRVRFRAVTGSGPLSDIAIDDVRVANVVPVFGCNDPTAANYSGGVNINDGSCDYGCPTGQKRVRIDLVADNYPGEISWSLKNGATGIDLVTGTSQGTTLCVPENTCLVFRINDSYGDGICCGYGNGHYAVYLDGQLIVQGGNYGAFQETTFNCPPGFSCSSAIPVVAPPLTGQYPQVLTTITTTDIEQWYDFTPPETGAYTITTCGTNTCDTRLWVYDMNCGQIVLSDGIEGATFGDDNEGGCGLQAVVNANLPGGVVHHLRIGDNAGACGGEVTFSIIYNGPVVGCMNVQSCNYEPLATIPCTDCCLAFGDPDCPQGPDLIMSQSALQNSIQLSTVNITDPCAPVEGCTRGLGLRYVLRFTTRIENIGTTDYYIGSPSSQPHMFDFNNCHGHAHYAGYADYLLFGSDGQAIPVGFKNGFCVIDVGCYPGFTAQYGCSNMGITKGCFDIYGSGTTCNWIDITDVPAGQYTLVLRTNWQQAPDALGRHEMNYSNNFAQVCINITRNAENVPSFSLVSDCPTWTDCLGQPYGDARYDCTGVCNGTVRMGDLNNDGQQTQPDAQEYLQGILGNDVPLSSCTDLNGDGVITVTDAALMANCYNQQHYHDQTAHVLHYHPWCDFPRGWVSTTDTVDLMLANLDPIAKTVDVLVRNPTCRMLGYEFEVSGITVQLVQNLAPGLQGYFAALSTLGGTKVIGMSYIDTTLAKNNAFVPLLRIHYLSLTGAEVCIAHITDIVNDEANNVITNIVGPCLVVPDVTPIEPYAWLEGAYEPGNLLMRDALRANALLPYTEPYTALGYVHVGGGGEQAHPDVFATTGPAAVVDWVVVELRSTQAPHAVVATRSALLLRNGRITATDGQSPVLMPAPPGSYHVAIRHRNHLGCMTAQPVTTTSTPITVDLRAPDTATWGTEARKALYGTTLLWMGNTFRDNKLLYTGGDNDRDPILQVVGGVVPTGSVTGYYQEDCNLNGVVLYTGAGNDRDPILANIGGVIPTASRSEQLP